MEFGKILILDNRKEITMSKLKFNKFGWITISWIEDNQLKHMKFDTVSEAKKFIKSLKGEICIT